MERCNYKRIIEYVLSKLQIKEKAYNASFVKYSMKRSKDRQMKQARNDILLDITQQMLDNTEFNEEMIPKEVAKKMLGFYEARKLDVLKIISNPFENDFKTKKYLFVLKLAVE